MTYQFIKDPKAIEKDSFRQIRELTDLSGLSEVQEQVVMRIVHTLGLPDVASHVRFTPSACDAGRNALQMSQPILCDVEMVKQGITKRMIENEPLCFLNDPAVPSIAQSSSETRTMAALDLWVPHLQNSVVVIGNAPTALFKLLEMIKNGVAKPALIVGMPVGFVGAAESKQALWDDCEKLGVECITLLGRMGGSGVSAATVNALLRCNRNEWY